MKLLLTNDDGIYAKGLWALSDRFSDKHSVTVVAPDRERSAVGHGITLHTPLRANRIDVNGSGWGYAVNGTSADCVKLGILELLDARPDLVISGINPGANTGPNINYSGTVAGARESALYGVPAIAVSIPGHNPAHYQDAAAFTEHLVEKAMKQGLPFGTILNVNFPDLPPDKIEGVRITRQGTSLAPEYIEKKVDPRNNAYYWYGYKPETSFDDPEIDDAALRDNYISITPIKCDITDYDMKKELESWDL